MAKSWATASELQGHRQWYRPQFERIGKWDSAEDPERCELKLWVWRTKASETRTLAAKSWPSPAFTFESWEVHSDFHYLQLKRNKLLHLYWIQIKVHEQTISVVRLLLNDLRKVYSAPTKTKSKTFRCLLFLLLYFPQTTIAAPPVDKT